MNKTMGGQKPLPSNVNLSNPLNLGKQTAENQHNFLKTGLQYGNKVNVSNLKLDECLNQSYTGNNLLEKAPLTVRPKLSDLLNRDLASADFDRLLLESQEKINKTPKYLKNIAIDHEN